MKQKAKTAPKRPRRTKLEILNEVPPLSQFARQRREELGYTQEQMAFRSGLNPRFIKEFERGKKTARLDKVIELLAFLGAELRAELRTRS